jgi:hypothetical protein
MKEDLEWRFIPQTTILTERVNHDLKNGFFPEYCIVEEQIRKGADDDFPDTWNLKKVNNLKTETDYFLQKTDEKIKISLDDIVLYSHILQRVSNTDFNYDVTALKLGRELGWQITEKQNGAECRRASKSMKKLRGAGYVFYFKTSGMIYPIVRMKDKISYDQEGRNSVTVSSEGKKTESGFLNFVPKEKRKSFFKAQERKRNKRTIETKKGTKKGVPKNAF